VAPGVFSAVGLLFPDTEHEFVQTFFAGSAEVSPEAVEGAYGKLEDEALSVLAAEGFARDRVTLSRSADMRYSGQAYELTIPVAAGTPRLDQMVKDFGAEHERTYGHRSDIDPVDLINIKVVARGATAGPKSYDPAGLIRAGGDDRTTRKAYFGRELGLLETPVISRGELSKGNREGPLIVEEYDATCLVPPGCRATLDEFGNIDIAVD
jgi:N-methylhydantoinase A